MRTLIQQRSALWKYEQKPFILLIIFLLAELYIEIYGTF